MIPAVRPYSILGSKRKERLWRAVIVDESDSALYWSCRHTHRSDTAAMKCAVRESRKRDRASA